MTWKRCGILVLLGAVLWGCEDGNYTIIKDDQVVLTRVWCLRVGNAKDGYSLQCADSKYAK